MRAATTFAVLMLLLGCQAPTPEEVAAQTANDVNELISGAVETARSTNNWASVDSTFAMGTRVGTVSTRPTIPADTGEQTLVRWLRFYAERIFKESNQVESGIFALRGAVLCANPDAPGLAVDPLCVKRIDDAQLRIRASAGIDLTLQVGPNHLEPFTLKLRSGRSIAYEVDLEQSQKAQAFLIAAYGGGSASTWTFDAKGRYEAKLEKNGTGDYTVSMSVLDDLVFGVTDERGVRRAFSTERRSPLVSLRVESVNRRATVALDIGKSQYDGAGSDLWNAADIGPLHAELAGLTAQATIEDGKSQQQVTGIGLGNGTSFIDYAGKTVLSVDVNESAGRKFDFVMRNTLSGTTAFDVSPSLEVTTAYWFAALPYESTTVHPAFSNARYTYAWKPGSGSNVSSEWQRPDFNFGGALKLVTGAFSLQSSLASDLSRQFSQGTCLGFRSSTTTSNPHPVLDMFEAVPCR